MGARPDLYKGVTPLLPSLQLELGGFVNFAHGGSIHMAAKTEGQAFYKSTGFKIGGLLTPVVAGLIVTAFAKWIPGPTPHPTANVSLTNWGTNPNDEGYAQSASIQYDNYGSRPAENCVASWETTDNRIIGTYNGVFGVPANGTMSITIYKSRLFFNGTYSTYISTKCGSQTANGSDVSAKL
jgi:hypothetical protein